jgi:hypothetical protein
MRGSTARSKAAAWKTNTAGFVTIEKVVQVAGHSWGALPLLQRFLKMGPRQDQWCARTRNTGGHGGSPPCCANWCKGKWLGKLEALQDEEEDINWEVGPAGACTSSCHSKYWELYSAQIHVINYICLYRRAKKPSYNSVRTRSPIW